MAHSIVKHNNKDVLFANHRGLVGADLLNSIKEVNKFILKEKKEYLIVADFTDSTGTSETNDYLQSEETKATAKYIPKQAIVGITGIKKMVLRVYNTLTGTKSGVFDSVEDALNYVTQE